MAWLGAIRIYRPLINELYVRLRQLSFLNPFPRFNPRSNVFTIVLAPSSLQNLWIKMRHGVYETRTRDARASWACKSTHINLALRMSATDSVDFPKVRGFRGKRPVLSLPFALTSVASCILCVRQRMLHPFCHKKTALDARTRIHLNRCPPNHGHGNSLRQTVD